jgi:hypothetical protein
MEEKVKLLEEAKSNVKWLLDNPNGLVGFHDIVYWATVVQNLRNEIKNSL